MPTMPTEQDNISRTPTIDVSLNEYDDPTVGAAVIVDWALRPASKNDHQLRMSFLNVLAESQDSPPDEKLVMYDACDAGEVRTNLGSALRKRLDARRNTKPKKADDQILVCTPFNHNGFHFGKIRNDKERLLKLALSGEQRYDVLTNKFPLFPKHMLLVADALVPQQMTGTHLAAITELISATSGFCAYFNSWGASASVNHFHCHVIDEFPPVTSLPLVPGPSLAGSRCLQPQGFPGFCYVFPLSQKAHVEAAILAMQADNQPHNLLVTPRHIYIWLKPIVRDPRSFDLYPETVGGPELLGSFTVYTREIFDGLSKEDCEELARLNTAPLPSRLFAASSMLGSAASSSACQTAIDDAALHASATSARATSRATIRKSRSMESSVALSAALHNGRLPQDRPIARALSHNEGLC